MGLDEDGKLFDRFLSPCGGVELLADVPTDRPIQLDQFLVGVGDDAILGSFDQGQNFCELGLEAIGHG